MEEDDEEEVSPTVYQTSSGTLYKSSSGENEQELPMLTKEQIIQLVIISILLVGAIGGGIYYFMNKRKGFNQSNSLTAFGQKIAKMIKI